MMRTAKTREKATPLFGGMLEIEIKKGKRGATCAVFGVIGVSELSSSGIVMLTHRGRISVRGSSLVLIIYDAGIAEVEGKIEEVALGYAEH